MIVYQNTKGNFIKDVDSGFIASMIEDEFVKHNIAHNNDAEHNAWDNSLPYMRDVLNTTEISDDCRLAIEFQIPYRNGAGTACLAAKLLEFLYWADIQNKFLFFLLIATDIRWVPGRRKPVNSSSSSPGISVNSSPT